MQISRKDMHAVLPTSIPSRCYELPFSKHPKSVQLALVGHLGNGFLGSGNDVNKAINVVTELNSYPPSRRRETYSSLHDHGNQKGGSYR